MRRNNFYERTFCASGFNKPNQPRKKNKMKNLIKSIAAVALLSVSAYAGDLVNVSGASKAAVSGYDTVAFFTDAKPVNGSPFISAEYQGATYFFASEEHKALFTASPEKYAPQCGGFCAYGVGLGKLFPVDINTWQVRNGKLYLNLNPAILEKFNADFDGNVAKADKKWPELVKKYSK
jgi:YHS domain-containing protein